jgi:hypothetical protein
MESHNEVMIYPGGWRFAATSAYLLAALAFCCAWMIHGPAYPGDWVGFALTLGVCILFFASLLFAVVRKWMVKKPAIILNEQGIYDASRLLASPGWIFWEEIDTYYPSQIGQWITIRVTLKDRAAFLRRQPALKRLWMTLNGVGRGTPLALMSVLLPISTYELYEQIANYRAEHSV